MKKYLRVALGLLLVLTLAVPALADVLYEPNDDFYEKHYRDCDYENRVYYTNGNHGYVTVYASPTGSGRDAIANGVAFLIYWTYDGGKWGCIEYDPDSRQAAYQNSVSGWVKMSDMVCDYDSQAFMDDHSGEFVGEERSFQPDRTEGEAVYAYKYPGSGVVRDKMDWDMIWSEPLSFSAVFTDPAGREWGYCGYHYGFRDFWVCLSDPYNGALAADENYVDPLASATPAADPDTVAKAASAARTPSVYLIAGIGGVVVIAAAILTAAVKRKRAS